MDGRGAAWIILLQADQRHAAFEEHEEERDPHPRPSSGGDLGGADGSGHSEGVDAQRHDESEQLQDVMRGYPEA